LQRRPHHCDEHRPISANILAFVKTLPFGKIPDRGDFKRFAGRDDERISYWRTVIAESERMADAFLEIGEKGLRPEQVRPL